MVVPTRPDSQAAKMLFSPGALWHRVTLPNVLSCTDHPFCTSNTGDATGCTNNLICMTQRLNLHSPLLFGRPAIGT